MRGLSAIGPMLLLSVAAARSAEPARPVFAPPPRLATTAAELADEKARPDFAAKRAAAIQAADALVASPVPLPDGPGSWIFYYACPDDGTDLRMISLGEHECPRCRKRYTDERTVAAYRCQMHYNLENTAIQLGWAYAWTGDDRYAAQVRRTLMHLADKYDGYPARVDRWGRRGILAPLGGRRYVQSLDEAVGVIRLAKAYDLTRGSPVWSDADRSHVEQDFFRATSKTLLTFNQGINNHQTWYNAGLMAIASVLADAELVEKVLTMRGGFHDQLAHSLGDDGLWYEGTMAYQNYALQAMVEIVDAGRRMKLELHQAPRFRALLASPLKVAYPDGQYPVINDSDPGGFQNFHWSYEWAWKTYREPRFAQAAAWGNPQKLAELLGPDARPEWPLESKSLDLPDAGLAILRAGEGPQQSCVFFDYGQHGGGHGHYDKLNITLFAAGREWLLDTGRIGYTHKEYTTWVKHTVAHNTVVINEADQAPTTGKLHWLKTGDGWSACSGECTTAYAGVTLRRRLWLSPKALIDVYDVESKEPAQIDWLAHCVSDPLVPLDDKAASEPAALGTGIGYPHLAEGRRWPPAAASRWDFPAGKQRLQVWCAGDAADELFTAVGIGRRVDEKAPALLRRRRGAKSARFVSVYDLSGEGTAVARMEAAAGATPEITLDVAGMTWRVTFTEHSVDVR